MTTDTVKRTVAVMAFATAIGLFSTIAAVAAVNTIQLKWDGTMCDSGPCGSAFAGIHRNTTRKIAAISQSSS